MSEEHEPEMERFPGRVDRCLYFASGEVKDGRRIVHFLYALMRDSLSLGYISHALRYTFEPTSDRMLLPGNTWVWLNADNQEGAISATQLFKQYPEVVPFVPSRLVDHPTELHARFLLVLLMNIPRDARTTVQDGLERALKMTPGDDETVAFISNGWLARYCQFIADALQDGLPP